MPSDIRPLLVRTLPYAAILWLLMALGSAWVWTQLPAEALLPVHFGLDGAVNRYGGKAEALLTLPAVTLLIALPLALLPWIEPRRRHLAQSLPAVVWILMATMLFMAAIHALMLAIALGHQPPVGRVIGGLVAVLWIVIGNVLGKLRSNFFVGVRTPWTLSSELSWQQTHRLTGKLFVAVGLLALLLVLFVGERAALTALVGGTLGVVVVSVAYSWQIWRNDPARHSTGA